VKTINASEVVATYKYGEVVTAAIQKNNIFATQFHPEKSQDVGLQILNNFIKWRP
jgi:glutamine amidotransferase